MLFRSRAVAGATVITATDSAPTVTAGSFSIGTSVPGSTSTTNSQTITLSGGESVTDVVTQILSKNIDYLLAEVSSTGALKLTHTKGGNILFTPISGTPLTSLGIDGDTPYVTLRNSGTLSGSNWITATYSASTETPAIDPMDGTYWYDARSEEHTSELQSH